MAPTALAGVCVWIVRHSNRGLGRFDVGWRACCPFVARTDLAVTALAVGVDLVEIDRVQQMLEKHGERGVRRMLTRAEVDYCLSRVHPAQHVAVRLAAKEASFKALQADDQANSVSWLDVEVETDGRGRPSVRLSGGADAAAQRLGATGALVSLSHSRNTAIAVVVLTG